MNNLIDRDKLIEELQTYKFFPYISSMEKEVEGLNDGIKLAIDIISNFPLQEKISKVKVNYHPCGISGICMNCGEDVYNEDLYCSHCGYKLEW